MIRIQKQISLPSEYWEAIESNIDNRLVRSRGDALIGILEKVYPHLTKVIIAPQDTKQKAKTPTQKSVPTIPTKQDIPLCTCGHPEGHHYDDGCMAEGGMCECNTFTEGAPP